MVKTRLNQTLRYNLLLHAKKLLTPDPLTPEYIAARDAIFDDLRKSFPPKDMTVLAKYDVARSNYKYLHVADSIGSYKTFNLLDGDKTEQPKLPNRIGSFRVSDAAFNALRLTPTP